MVEATFQSAKNRYGVIQVVVTPREEEGVSEKANKNEQVFIVSIIQWEKVRCIDSNITSRPSRAATLESQV